MIKPSHPKYRNHTGILVDKTVLFDIGEKEFLKTNPKYIFITHLHPDHAFFIEEKETSIDKKIPIYGPINYKNKTLVEKMKNEMRVESGHTIIPIPTHHSVKVDSQAYLIIKQNKNVLITGDLIWIDKRYHHLLDDLDLVITDGSYINRGGRVIKDKKTNQLYGHTGIPNLMDLFKEFTNKIAFLHFGSWFYKDIERSKQKIKDLAEEKKIEAIISYDGMELKV